MPADCATTYDLDRLADRLRPLELRHARVTASTNGWAKQEARSGAVLAPALFLADSQTAGRGRGGNGWWSPPGNVAATFVFARHSHLAFGLVPLLAGLAVRRALVRLSACEEIGLKWPNDLVLNGRKAAGLLCERLQHVDLIGVGVNVNAGSEDAPAELRERIVSLRELSGNAWDATDVVCEIGQELWRVASVESEIAARQMLEEYSQYHWPTGKTIELIDTEWAPRVRGRCGGIDSEGRLIVETGQQSYALLTGSIVSVTPATSSD